MRTRQGETLAHHRRMLEHPPLQQAGSRPNMRHQKARLSNRFLHSLANHWFRVQRRNNKCENRRDQIPPSQKNGRCSGLTLIEVILATMILAVGMSTLLAAAGRCLAVARKAKEYEVARRLVGQVDLEIPINFEEIEEGTESRQFGAPFSDYRWEREIELYPVEEYGVYSVRTQVSWSTKGRDANEETVTYIYGPAYIRGGKGGRQ